MQNMQSDIESPRKISVCWTGRKYFLLVDLDNFVLLRGPTKFDRSINKVFMVKVEFE